MGRLSSPRSSDGARWVLSIALALTLASSSPANTGPLSTVTIDTQQVQNPRAPRVLGMGFDARASFYNPLDPVRLIGYYDRNTGAPLPIATLWEDEWPQPSLRYPQGPINTWEWKKTVGPIGERPIITSQGQIAAFGLQEFLDMTERNGMSPSDITMMVNLWGPGGFGSPNTPLALQDAADLVAYLNKPWDGQPFDGSNFEALRAQSHVAPYGVRYFNLGNEPWGSAEFDFKTTGDPDSTQDGALRYAALAQQFITVMRLVDSSLWIALPGSSLSLNPTNMAKAFAWNDTLMQRLGGQIQAISTNTYYEFEPADLGLRGVQKVGDQLSQASARIATFNTLHGTTIRHVIGEHGNTLDFNYATNPPTLLDPVDFNMCYQGAVTTADFLMMVSNMPELERVHHFIWGNTNAVWRPIKSEVQGGVTVYTIFPPAELYRALGSRVLDEAVSAITVSAAGSDGASYAVRGGAFRSNDGERVNVILVNRDPSVDQTIDVAQMGSYDLLSTTIMASDSAYGFTAHFDPFPFTPGQSRFDVPSLSVLMLDYQLASLDATTAPTPVALAFAGALPNPASRTTRLRYALPREAHVRLALFDVSGRRVRTVGDGLQGAGEHTIPWDGRDDSGHRVRGGVYLARLSTDGALLTQRVVLLD